MAFQFDPAAFVKRLEGEGVPSRQAHAHVDALRDALLGGVASRSDMQNVIEEIDGLRGSVIEIQGRVDGMAEGVRADLDAWRHDVDGRLDAIAAAVMGQNQNKGGGVVWWFLTILAVVCVVVAGFVAGVVAPEEWINAVLELFA